jgi:cellobiose phosphorylase
MKHQYASGMALRGWNPVDQKAYSDSALWLVFTLCSYLKESGDLDFLEESYPYFDEGRDSVLKHVQKALDFLEANRGQHGLCLIKFGDWNDSLTAIGKEGRGESIWLSMAYAEALREMKDLYEELGKEAMATLMEDRYLSIREAVNRHAWDGHWYLRCFDDEGLPIGSASNKQGRIFLNAQSWALISGIATPERAEACIQSADELLATTMGYRLLAPTFMEPEDRIGRISCLEPGICENGTVYSHVNAWMVLGLLRAGKPDKAYEVFRQITPGYPSGANPDPKENMPPYIFANGYYGPDHRNNPYQMEFTWITGSVAWFYNVLSREMLGVKPGYGGLRLEPRLPSEWDSCQVSRVFRGRHFRISIRRSPGKEEKLILNGERLESRDIPLELCRPENEIELWIPKASP